MYGVYIWEAIPQLEIGKCVGVQVVYLLHATLVATSDFAYPIFVWNPLFFVSQRGKYVAVFVGGEYEYHGGNSMKAVEEAMVAAAAAAMAVVTVVVVLIWLWRWLSWRAGWLPSFPYTIERNKILYVTNPSHILWCNFAQFYFLCYTAHTHAAFSFQSNHHQQFQLSFSAVAFALASVRLFGHHCWCRCFGKLHTQADIGWFISYTSHLIEHVPKSLL